MKAKAGTRDVRHTSGSYKRVVEKPNMLVTIDHMYMLDKNKMPGIHVYKYILQVLDLFQPYFGWSFPTNQQNGKR